MNEIRSLPEFPKECLELYTNGTSKVAYTDNGNDLEIAGIHMMCGELIDEFPAFLKHVLELYPDNLEYALIAADLLSVQVADYDRDIYDLVWNLLDQHHMQDQPNQVIFRAMRELQATMWEWGMMPIRSSHENE